jgi:hypothetical protein
MPVRQGDLGLLQHPVSLELLESRIPARLAYVWMDGTPRVIPIWFHWNGREFVMGTPPKAPKLLIRGTARLDTVEGIVPEYVTAAERYFGREQGQAWIAQLRGLIPNMVRITVAPEWVGLLDFQTRFPSALSPD